jgi:transposase
MTRVFNDKNIALMRTMARNGQSASDIASKIGSTDGSVRVLASRHGIRFHPRVFNDKNIALMRTMAREGKSVSEVAEKIGSTSGSVRTSASRLGIRFRSHNRSSERNDSVQMIVVIPRSTWARLSTLAKQTGLRSASSLARNCLEELVRSYSHSAQKPSNEPNRKRAFSFQSPVWWKTLKVQTFTGSIEFHADQCALQPSDQAEQRLIVVGGLPVHYYRAEDAVAEAYAMAFLVESGFAQQSDVARAFGWLVGTVRQHQRRYAQGGMAALGREEGWRRGRRRLIEPLASLDCALGKRNVSAAAIHNPRSR